MKKSIILGLATMMSLSLAACSSQIQVNLLSLAIQLGPIPEVHRE